TTPLIEAVRTGDREFIEKLLTETNCKISVSTANKGINASHVAAELDRLDILELLLQKGANFRAVDSQNR
ncbi:MAG: Poly [ADP-ribose] polymerase tankyrase-2, partial [Paramarteilia canceri]